MLQSLLTSQRRPIIVHVVPATATTEEANAEPSALRQLADLALAKRGLGDVPTVVAAWRNDNTPWDEIPSKLHAACGVWMSASTIRNNVPHLVGTRVARRRRRN